MRRRHYGDLLKGNPSLRIEDETAVEHIRNAMQLLQEGQRLHRDQTDLAAGVYDRLEKALAALAKAPRRNPYIVTYGTNPALPYRQGTGAYRDRVSGRILGQIAADMHAVTYRHADDGEPYKHDFNLDVEAFAVRLDDGRMVALLVGRNGQPVVVNV